MFPFYTPWKHQETKKRREWHSLMLLAWHASSSIVKQNGCKNKTTWLTQTALCESFFLFHTTYIIPLTLKTLKNFLKDYFFIQNLFYIKRFSNEIVFKCSKNVKLKKGSHAEWKIENNCNFAKINSGFFCSALFYSTFITTLLKVAFKTSGECCW